MTNNDEMVLKPVGNLFTSDKGEVLFSPSKWPVSGFEFAGCVYSDEQVNTLLAERDADKKLIAEQQKHITSLEEGVNVLLAQYDQLAAAIGWTTEKALSGEGNQEQYAESMVKRLAELETRTVSVKLPEPIGPEAAPAHWDNSESTAYADGYNKATSDAKNLCAAAVLQNRDVASLAIPTGWKLVPIDPTKDMLRAGQSVVGFWLNTVHCYSKMLAAAPEAPGQQEVED